MLKKLRWYLTLFWYNIKAWRTDVWTDGQNCDISIRRQHLQWRRAIKPNHEYSCRHTWQWRHRGSESHESSGWEAVGMQGGRHVVVGPLAARCARRRPGDRRQPGVTVYHAVEAETSERHRRRRHTSASATAAARRNRQRQRVRSADRSSTAATRSNWEVFHRSTFNLHRHRGGCGGSDGEGPRGCRLDRRGCRGGRRQLGDVVARWTGADDVTTSWRVRVEHELELMTLTLKVWNLFLELQLLILQTLRLLRTHSHTPSIIVYQRRGSRL